MTLLTALPFTLVTTVIVAIVLTAQRRRWSQRLRGHKTPPGPQGWPIIGCLFELPSGDRPWTVYREWAHKYGDLTLFKVPNTPMLLVSSGEIILELTEKRSAIYSDKPQQAIDELTGWQFDMSTMPYGPQWRITRRMFHQHFNQTVTPKYYDKQTKEIYEFLARCLDQPSGKPLDPQCIRLTLAAIIMDIVYGIQVQNMDDDYIKLAEQTTEVFNQSRLMGKFWIDFLPILKHVPSWVPGAAAVQYAKTWRPVVDATVNRSFDAVKQRVCSDEARLACVASELIDEISQGGNPERNCEEEQHAKNATAIAYVAGADTTVSLIQTFFCCMAMHPEVQKKAQEELDLVVGQDRLPTYGDWNYLPYIHAILMECSRWLPVVPISLPRRAIADDYYEGGYFIPEGTVVIANIWHILRDPHVYPDPQRFNPDRFMKDGALDHNVPDPNRLAFGFGRRICPGRHLAKETAFLTMAAVLHVFNVLPAVNENGQELDPTPQMTTGVQSYPDPLNYTLKPRSEAAERLIRAVVL